MREFFDYLDRLRLCGVTNMYGAGPYLEDAFDLSPAEARKILALWMETFSDVSVDARARAAVVILKKEEKRRVRHA